MKSLFSVPAYGLAWPAFWLALAGVLFTVVSIIADSATGVLLGCGVVAILISIGVWQEIRAVVWGAFGICLVFAVLHLIRAAIEGQWRPVGYAVGFGSIAYSCWDGLQRQKVAMQSGDGLQGSHGADRPDASDEDDSAATMVSLVMLCRKAKYLESAMLAKIVESTWGGRYDGSNAESEDESADGFVVGDSPLFVIKTQDHMLLVHNHHQQYWEDTPGVAETIGELRLQKCIADHNAWFSVDVLGDPPAGEQEPEVYLQLGQLLAALADEDSLLVLHPASGNMNVWSPEIAERIVAPGGVAELAVFDNSPVIPVDGDHPLLVESVRKATESFGEFIAAFEDRSETESDFLVKVKLTVDGVTEYIWVDVLGFEPVKVGRERHLYGTLANDPVDLGDLVLGARVDIPITDVCDWGYLKDGEPVGMFSLEAIRQIQQEKVEQ